MRFILDTCVLIWYFGGSDQIIESIRDLLTDPTNDIYMSDVSVLEIVIKNSIGKLPLPKSPSHLLPVLVERHMIDSLPLTRNAIFRLETLPRIHRDPFDRLLIAQALEHNMTLISPDPLIAKYQVPLLWN